MGSGRTFKTRLIVMCDINNFAIKQTNNQLKCYPYSILVYRGVEYWNMIDY